MAPYKPPTFTLGRVLVSLSAIASITGPFIADFNETHVYNPNWPPHARFHNGQTMSMGAALGLLALFLTYRSSFNKSLISVSALAHLEYQRQDLLAATLVGSLYWITGISAILYPGAAGMDPEFGGPDEFPQAPVFLMLVGLAWAGWCVDGRRLSAATAEVGGQGKGA